MKGAKLHIKANIITGLFIGLCVAVLNLAPSWSQLHFTNLDFLLYATIFCFIVALLKSASYHPQRKKEITKLFKRVSVRLEHSFNWMAYLFGGVIILGVNSESILIVWLHFIFTGAAILLGYITILIYPSSNTGKTWSYWGVALGLGGFCFGFFPFIKLYSIALGEVIAALPIAIFILYTITNETKR